MPFTVVRDDLTRMNVDAIVNTANPKPLIGTGTDSAIYKAAGAQKLLKERMKIGDIARGDAAITGAYSLPAKYIIHTVGPIWIDGTHGEADLLRSCYEKSLAIALKRKCKSIAFPLISTGNYRFPKDLALKIVIETVGAFLEKEDMMIYLVVFGSDTTRLSERMFASIEERIDDTYALKKETEEYDLEDDFYFRESSANRRRRESDLFEEGQIREPHIFGSPQPQNLIAKKAPSSKRTLEQLLKQKDETFAQMLLRLASERGMTNVELYKKANQDKKSFSKIKSGKQNPSKKTAMAYALALELNLDEAKDLLARAGHAFSPCENLDKVIQYCIETHEFNIIEVEIILYDLGLETLCNH